MMADSDTDNDDRGAPIRRVISDTTDEENSSMNDVVSQSSWTDTETNARHHMMAQSTTMDPPLRSSSTPSSIALQQQQQQRRMMMMDEEERVVANSSQQHQSQTASSSSSKEETATETGLFPKLLAPLHRSSRQFLGLAANYTDATALFSSKSHMTTETQREQQQQANKVREKEESDGSDNDDTACVSRAQSCRNDNDDVDDDNNPLLAKFHYSSQNSLQSQKSAWSEQSWRSTQSWGQLTEIDLPPKVNDMEAPTYVLEESPSNQNLWRQTAGHRPPQPMEERAFFEKMWADNFSRSQVEYGVPVRDLVNGAAVATSLTSPAMIVEEDDTATASDTAMYSSLFSIAPPSHRSTTSSYHHHHSHQEDLAEAILVSRMNDYNMTMDSSSPRMSSLSQRQLLDKDTTVLYKGINAFGTTVSKSFAQTGREGLISVTTVNVNVASYRVVQSKRHGRYAQFHVIYREGNMRDTIGVWKRYRDFEMLANKISDSCEGCSMLHHVGSSQQQNQQQHHHHVIEPEVEQLPNAITSWRLMKKRKRWYRCLDAGYLSLKVFLLERFLHDVLFESSSPFLLRDFVLTNLGEDAPSVPNSP